MLVVPNEIKRFDSTAGVDRHGKFHFGGMRYRGTVKADAR